MNNKTKKFYKTVLIPIEVPCGDYCWGNDRICEYLNDEGEEPFCTFGFEPIRFDTDSQIPKPIECRMLQEKYENSYKKT